MANPSKKAISKAVKDKHIIITGASSGIGERTAYLLSECGAHVILLARTEDKLLGRRKHVKRESHFILVLLLLHPLREVGGLGRAQGGLGQSA